MYAFVHVCVCSCVCVRVYVCLCVFVCVCMRMLHGHLQHAAGEPSPSGEVRFVETAMSHRYFTHSKLLSPLAICMYKGKMPLIAYPPCAQNNLLEYLLHTTHQPPNPATVAPQLEESVSTTHNTIHNTQYTIV